MLTSKYIKLNCTVVAICCWCWDKKVKTWLKLEKILTPYTKVVIPINFFKDSTFLCFTIKCCHFATWQVTITEGVANQSASNTWQLVLGFPKVEYFRRFMTPVPLRRHRSGCSGQGKGSQAVYLQRQTYQVELCWVTFAHNPSEGDHHVPLEPDPSDEGVVGVVEVVGVAEVLVHLVAPPGVKWG